MMELKEITLAELLSNASGTDYFPVFAKLIGHSSDAVLYEGIGDKELEFLEEVEEALGYSIPSHYLEFLGFLNGGVFFNINLFSLTNKENPNSLFSRNFYSNIKEELNLADSVLIIGKFDHYVIYVDCGEEEDNSYTLMDIKNSEKIDFQSISALIGFIFYILVIKENKKIEEEKKQIDEMRDKLHDDFKKRNSFLKKEKEKNSAKLRARVAGRALREQMRKAKRSK